MIDSIIRLACYFYKAAEDNLYLYHETLEEYLNDIALEGLRPTSYGQSFVSDIDGSVRSPEEIMDEIREELEEESENLSDEEFENKVSERFEEIIDSDDLRRRTYIHLHEPNSYSYGEVLLRFPRSAGGIIEHDVDFYITKTIAPELIEMKKDGEWVKL